MPINYPFFVFILLYSFNVYGYVGPGLGLGFIVSVLGIIFSIIFAFVAILYFPIKRLLKKKKKKISDPHTYNSNFNNIN